jgi:uncharacterized protein (DUF1778 family)
MANETRTEQLQIRVSPSQKRGLRRAAHAAGMSVSAWVLSRALPSQRQAFDSLLVDLAQSGNTSFELAALNDFLAALPRGELSTVLAAPPGVPLPRRVACHVAAMVEHTAYRKGAAVPGWVHDVPPLEQPDFATELISLRLHLLTNSPPAFRRRNLFVDATVGDRV